MTFHKLCIGFVVLLPVAAQTAGQIEPNAGKWKTWAISSGKDFRVPPPPDAAGRVSRPGPAYRSRRLPG